MEKRDYWKYLFLSVILLSSIIVLSRILFHREIDDLSPGIPCEQELIDKSAVLWVIPKFNNQSIAENKEWCDKILALNKTLGLHGVYHYYNEFGEDVDAKYIEEGVEIFKKCFGFYPDKFKPPQLAISKNNVRVIRTKMRIYGYANQVMHKVYHCNNSGLFSNKLIDWV